MRHSNISVFVPHIGCPQRCTFCNQNYITGQTYKPTANDVISAVETAKKTAGYNPNNTELAFFGGSFTAIDKEYRLELLNEGYKFVKDGSICGIRISTRPDAITPEIIEELINHGVKAVELGAQSMDDNVLLLNRRGHTAKDVKNASLLIKNAGLELGLQMMTGLMGDTDEKAIKTAERIIAINPKTVRVYPTIVLKNTYLAAAFKSGTYFPQTVDEAVALSAKIIYMFYKNNINVIRLGLHSIDESAYVAGPWHPAFGELTEGEIYYNITKNLLANSPHKNYTVYVGKSFVSKAVGQHRKNITRLKEIGYDCTVKTDEKLNNYEVYIK